MHYHCEIIIPPTTDIETSIRTVLKQFDENMSENEECSRSHAFWDFWVIGGRFAGHHLLAQYEKAKIDAFYEWCDAEKITVSSFRAGKQSLEPKTQIPKVDAKWNEMFPSQAPIPCPLFAHSNDQYARNGELSGMLPQDVITLKDLPLNLECSRVIVAEINYKGQLEAKFMLVDDAWNGCNYMKVDWDGKVLTALEKYREKCKHYAADIAEKRMPKGDWLVVTVDYHS